MTQQHPSLAELQYALQDFLLNKSEAAESLTQETAQFSRAQRLNIYHHAYRARLVDALRQDFPAVEKLLGEEKFWQLTVDYVTAHPSQHPSLRWLGKNLPAFLTTHTYGQESILLAELAEFEWTQVMAFDAADNTLATLDDVRQLAPDAWMYLRLQFHPSVNLMSSYTNAPLVWQALIQQTNTVAPETRETREYWLIWRDNGRVVFRLLSEAEAWALAAFRREHSFAQVCEGLCQWFANAQVPLEAATFLQYWINAGLVTELRTNE